MATHAIKMTLFIITLNVFVNADSEYYQRDSYVADCSENLSIPWLPRALIQGFSSECLPKDQAYLIEDLVGNLDYCIPKPENKEHAFLKSEKLDIIKNSDGSFDRIIITRCKGETKRFFFRYDQNGKLKYMKKYNIVGDRYIPINEE